MSKVRFIGLDVHAETIAVAIAVAMMWIYFHRYEHYVAINSALWRPQLAQWKRILSIGLPAGGEFAIIFVNMAVIYYALRHFGAAAQAGFSIGSRLLGVLHMPGISIAFAAGAIAVAVASILKTAAIRRGRKLRGDRSSSQHTSHVPAVGNASSPRRASGQRSS